MSGYAHVRNGSNSDLGAPEREVRFAPIIGHRQLGGALLKSATSGLVHRSKCRAGFVQLAGSVQAALSQSTIKSRLIGTASRLVDSSN